MKKNNYNLKIRKNVLLKNHTTFKIGGPAEYFFRAKTKKEIMKAVKWAKEKKLPFFILGNGSNVLFSDNGFKGLVIKFQVSRQRRGSPEAANFKLQKNIIIANAGAKLTDLVKFSASKGFSGLEWAAGMPGTIGGAVYGNAAAFGKSIRDNVKEVEAFDCLKLLIKKINDRDCCFGPKTSIFKKNKNLLIFSVILEIKKGEPKKIKEQIKRYLACRKKHPQEPSAGCIFKNHELKTKSEGFNERALKNFPDYENFKKSGFIPSSFLIDKSGLKGKRIGGAMVSLKHANFIVNAGRAKAADVLNLIRLIKNKVKNKFEIKLEEELITVKTQRQGED